MKVGFVPWLSSREVGSFPWLSPINVEFYGFFFFAFKFKFISSTSSLYDICTQNFLKVPYTMS